MQKATDAARSTRGAPAAAKSGSRARVVLVVILLVAAAFGAGALWVHLRTRADRAAWQEERTALGERLAGLEAEVAAARAREVVHGLDGRISKMLVDLAEKNYGLARDEASALARSVSTASADLPDAWRAGLDQAASLLDDAARAADSLSPDARGRALQARDLLRGLVGGAAAGP